MILDETEEWGPSPLRAIVQLIDLTWYAERERGRGGQVKDMGLMAQLHNGAYDSHVVRTESGSFDECASKNCEVYIGKDD